MNRGLQNRGGGGASHQGHRKGPAVQQRRWQTARFGGTPRIQIPGFERAAAIC